MADKNWLTKEVKEKITGFKGIVMGVTSYVTGCDQVLVQPQNMKDGEFPTSVWLDENRVEFTGNSVNFDNPNPGNGPDKPAPIK